MRTPCETPPGSCSPSPSCSSAAERIPRTNARAPPSTCPMPACTAPPYPAVSTTCGDYIDIAGCGGCQFYACREAEHACGASGYYLAYAEKYCVRFLDVARDCLMRYVDDELPPADACDDVRARAFHSHVACYHDNGFCELPL